MNHCGSKWSVLLVLTVLVGVGACKDGGTTTDPPGGNGTNPAIGVIVAPQSVTVTQGASGSVGVTVTRSGGFSGEIALTLQGLPSGVTGDANPAAVPASATSATINLNVGAAVAAGTYTVTVRATGAGVTAQTATFSLTVTAVPLSSYTLAVNPTSVSLQQGGSGAVTVAVTRTNFTETVALSLSGAPPGLVTAFNPANVSGNSSALSLDAGQTTTPGTYTLTIKGTANSVADQTVSLEVTVTAAPPSGPVTWPYCAATGVPTWVAYQDGSNAWTNATPTGNTYTFNLSASKGGIASATATVGSVGTVIDVEVFYGTTTELVAMGAARCPGSGQLEDYTGSVAGFAATDQAWIAMDDVTAIVFPPVDPAFRLTNVPDGAHDVIAALISLKLVGGIPDYSLERIIIRRGLDPAPSAVLPVFDFSASEAFAPLIHTVSLSNLGADAALTLMGYHTPTGTTASFFTDIGPSTATSRPYPGIPAAQQAAGDLHTLTILATPPPGPALTEMRSATIMFGEAGDKAVTLGPSMGAVTVTAAATSPYVMPRLQTGIQPEYNKYFAAAFSQSAGGVERSLTIAASAAYVGSGASTVDVTMPDFSTVANWNSSWGFIVGSPITWWFTATGWGAPGGIATSPFVDGGISRTASKTGGLGT